MLLVKFNKTETKNGIIDFGIESATEYILFTRFLFDENVYAYTTSKISLQKDPEQTDDNSILVRCRMPFSSKEMTKIWIPKAMFYDSRYLLCSQSVDEPLKHNVQLFGGSPNIFSVFGILFDEEGTAYETYLDPVKDKLRLIFRDKDKGIVYLTEWETLEEDYYDKNQMIVSATSSDGLYVRTLIIDMLPYPHAIIRLTF